MKEHTAILTNLTPEVEYFFRVSSTDQSGNSSQSDEFTIAPEEFTYIPFVLR